ncbi:MAG: hypothetical protein R2748_09460 [Bryobacterales bacterium]
MIRINLLEVRPQSGERLGALLGGRGSSTFISRREALAGAAFLVLTVGILTMVAMQLGSGEESAEAVTTAAADLEVEPIDPESLELAENGAELTPPTPFREASLQASLETPPNAPVPAGAPAEGQSRPPAASPKPRPASVRPASAAKTVDVSAVRATPSPIASMSSSR